MKKKLRNGPDAFEENPLPMAGTAKRTADAVLGALKTGSGLISLMSGLLAAAMILYSGYVLYDSFVTQQRAYSSSWDLLQYKPEIIESGVKPSGGTETLADINRDYRGWLTVYDSGIDYPVVQGPDDLYYASHDIYGNTSLTGAIYLAAGNAKDGSDSYNLIYGHHMDNGAMFGTLDKFRDEQFFSSHREGILVTESGIYDLTAFAVLNTDAYESRIYATGSRAQEVVSFLTGNRSQDAGLGTTVMILDRETAGSAKRVLALSTCDDAATNGRLVVMFRMTARPLPTGPKAITEPTATNATAQETATATPTATNPATAKPVTRPTESPTADPAAFVPVATPTVYPGPYRLEIRYEFITGGIAAPAWQEKLMSGEAYNRAVPVIPGYTTSRQVIQGTMGTQDILMIVLYVPDGERLVSLKDYETPLGLINLHAQMGICAE